MLSQASAQALTRLRAYVPPATQWYNCPPTRRAAVLILLFPDRQGDLKVVLTMRAATLRNYAGQAALPGGKADTQDEAPFMTARREAFEEIGLPEADERLPRGFQVEHLCEMPTNLAKTELAVRPCVALLTPTSALSGDASLPSSLPDVEDKMIPILDPKEVAAVFTAPFHNFLRREWDSPGTGPRSKDGTAHSWYRGSWVTWHESRWRMHNFYVPRPPASSSGLQHNPRQSKSSTKSSRTDCVVPEGDDPRPEPSPFDELSTFRVFGMTARILVDAARVAYGEEPEFEHNSHHGDEEMIRRLLQAGRLSETRNEGEELTNEVMKEAVRVTSKM